MLLDDKYSKKAEPHYLSIGNLTSKQQQKIKSSIVDTNNQLNEVYPSFNRLHKELLPGFQLVDNFADHFSFNTVNCKNTEVISNASIKNNVVTLISHICSS